MARVTFDADAAAKLAKTRKVNLGDSYQVWVRRIPGDKLYEFEAAREAPDQEQAFRVLVLLLCDAKGKPTYGSWSSRAYHELKEWPAGYIAKVINEGTDLNGLQDDDDPN